MFSREIDGDTNGSYFALQMLAQISSRRVELKALFLKYLYIFVLTV